MKRLENFKAGFIRENPIFGLYLGLCSALAISTSLNNAIGMGLAVTAVLICSNIIISLIRKITPDEIRIPVYIVVIAALVKIVQMFVQAYAQDLYTALGIFLPLIVVNCIILGRAEAFASKNGIFDSALDGLGMGLGYTSGLLALSVIRQILSTGMLSFSNPFNPNFVIFETTFFSSEYTISLFSEPIGAFFTFACLAATLTAFKNSENKKPWKIGAGIVALVLVGFIALRSDFMIDNTPAPAPVEEETPAPAAETGILSNENGVYTVAVNGGFNPSGVNTFEITVVDNAISSVTVVSIEDTEGIGDTIDNEEYLGQFAGINSSDFEVDVQSGATLSSGSCEEAVRLVLEDLGL